MGNAIWPLFLIVGSNIAYQLSSRGAAKDVNPFAALVVAYTIATVASLALFLATAKSVSLATEARALNWGNYVLGLAIIGLEGGFLCLYRHGWNASVGPVVTYAAVAVPKSELFFAIVMAFVPITKVLYALIAASVLAQRNLANSELSIVATFAGGAFALIAVVQGAWAAKLINAPTAKEGLLGTFPFKMAMLGLIETLAVFALVGTLVFATRLAA